MGPGVLREEAGLGIWAGFHAEGFRKLWTYVCTLPPTLPRTLMTKNKANREKRMCAAGGRGLEHGKDCEESLPAGPKPSVTQQSINKPRAVASPVQPNKLLSRHNKTSY